MQRMDLRSPGDPKEFDPIAIYKIYSALRFPKPEQKFDREKFLAPYKTEFTSRSVKADLPPPEQHNADFLGGAIKGAAAGYLMLSLVFLALNEQSVSLATAISWMNTQLNPPRKGRPKKGELYIPRSTRLLIPLMKEFGSVAHLWAAAFYVAQAQEEESPELSESGGNFLPTTNEEIPKFLAHAEEILRLYKSIPLKQGIDPETKRILLNPAVIRDFWQFTVPNDMRLSRSLRARPLPSSSSGL